MSSMIHSSALPYIAMILGDNLPADLVLLISQLLCVMTKAPEADVLFVGCDFYRRLASIQTVAERNGETAVAESIVQTLAAIRANCPLVALSMQQTQSNFAAGDAGDAGDAGEAKEDAKDLSPRADDGEGEIAMEKTPTLSRVTDYQISNVSQLTIPKILEFMSRVTKRKMQIELFTSIFDAWISNKGNSLQYSEIKQIAESLADWVHGSAFSDPSCMHYWTCLDILTRCRVRNSLVMPSVHQKEDDRCDESFV